MRYFGSSQKGRPGSERSVDEQAQSANSRQTSSLIFGALFDFLLLSLKCGWALEIEACPCGSGVRVFKPNLSVLVISRSGGRRTRELTPGTGTQREQVVEAEACTRCSLRTEHLRSPLPRSPGDRGRLRVFDVARRRVETLRQRPRRSNPRGLCKRSVVQHVQLSQSWPYKLQAIIARQTEALRFQLCGSSCFDKVQCICSFFHSKVSERHVSSLAWTRLDRRCSAAFRLFDR